MARTRSSALRPIVVTRDGVSWRHLFLPVLSAYPIMHMATANPGQIPFHSIVLATLVAITVAAMLAILCRPLASGWSAAACAATFLVALFFAYGPTHTALETHLLQLEQRGGAEVEQFTDRLHFWLSAVWLVITACGLWAICRLWRGPSARFITALDVVAGVLMLFILAELGTWISESNRMHSRTSLGPTTSANMGVLGYNPDIYYIILDGYARADVLQRYYGFDNGAFLEELENHGFQINTRSSANYYWTFLSLASSLNMGYVQELFGDGLPPESPDRTVLYDAIRNNEVAHFLRQYGYRFVHFQSTWGATLYNPYADAQIRCQVGLFQDEFFRALAETSWLKVLQSRAGQDLARCHLSNLESLARMGSVPGPKFVFAHFLPPHHPYLFDRGGRILRNASLSSQFEFHKRLWEKRGMYIDQLQFVNERVIDAVHRILERSAHPPIIVIQSDHGPQLTSGLEEVEQRRVRLANFAAYLMPGAPPALLPPDGSPVNQFRRILSHYFGAKLPVLPDRYFYSSFRRPYAFEPVDELDLAPLSSLAQ